MRLPSVFVSHGSPMFALEPGDAGRFLQRLGPAIDAEFSRPQAIVSVSAHTTGHSPVVLGAVRHAAIYDFGGFDPQLRTLRYDAPGDPALAGRIVELGEAAGVGIGRVDHGGLDHGAWTALRFLYPAVDVPIVPVAFDSAASPQAQFALGAALAPLADDGVLVLASGSITHNLRLLVGGDDGSAEKAESRDFRDWFAARAEALDWDALFDYRRAAPNARLMHPTDEHLLPWFVAAGAGGHEHRPRRIHAGATLGSLGMDAYRFGVD